MSARMDRLHVYERAVGQSTRQVGQGWHRGGTEKLEIIKSFVAELVLSDAIFVTWLQQWYLSCCLLLSLIL